MASLSTSCNCSTSGAGTRSIRSSLSSFTRSPCLSASFVMRLSLEFETALLCPVEAEDPVRFSSTDDILPYLSHSCSSVSEFDSHSELESASLSTSFCGFNDSRNSHRITLGSLIRLPMDSFRGSFRFPGSSQRSSEPGSSPRRSRTCSLLSELLCYLQARWYRADYVHVKSPGTGNLTSFATTEASEPASEEEEGWNDVEATVFENSVFVDRDTLGSRIYEFNPLFISDAISEVDPSDARGLSFRVASACGNGENGMKNGS